jgi:pimeloyl-ACP methyl ester carboxylesterase
LWPPRGPPIIRPVDCGRQETVAIKVRANDITTAFVGSELLVLPKAAHCSCVEAADEFNRALLAILARVD